MKRIGKKASYVKLVKKYVICTFWLVGCASMVSGCGSKLEQPYVFENRAVWTENTKRDDYQDDSAEDGFFNSFAKELCVITDESQSQDGQVSAEAAALFDISDRTVMYSKNAFEQLYPASVTKVMTALVAIKYGNLSDVVTVTEEAVITEPGATLAYIHPGDQLTMEQLLYGLMLPSGNDAGNAIAVHMKGSVEAFSELMNEEAQKLGATGTHFVNPHGLTDKEHYTTAYDLYLIFNEALKLPEFRKVVGTTTYAAEYKDGDGKTVSQTWTGGNRFMIGERETPEGLTVFGGKTGTTSAAGYCLIMGSKELKTEKEYISVVLKAGSRTDLYDNMTNIISKIVD